MADKFVRHIRLGGTLKTSTGVYGGKKFVNGFTTVRMSDEDFARVMRYFIKCYQATEEKNVGERKADQDRSQRPGPSVESGVPEDWGTAEGTSDVGIVNDGPEAGSGERPPSIRNRSKRSKTSVRTPNVDNT